jgi:hypothetical protein
MSNEEKWHKNEGMPDPEQIKGILNVVSEKVPSLLKELAQVLYGPQESKQFAVAVATFYLELKNAGMTDEQAFELTRQYMSTLNIGHMMKGFGSSAHKSHPHHDDK